MIVQQSKYDFELWDEVITLSSEMVLGGTKLLSLYKEKSLSAYLDHMFQNNKIYGSMKSRSYSRQLFFHVPSYRDIVKRCLISFSRRYEDETYAESYDDIILANRQKTVYVNPPLRTLTGLVTLIKLYQRLVLDSRIVFEEYNSLMSQFLLEMVPKINNICDNFILYLQSRYTRTADEDFSFKITQFCMTTFNKTTLSFLSKLKNIDHKHKLITNLTLYATNTESVLNTFRMFRLNINHNGCDK